MKLTSIPQLPFKIWQKNKLSILIFHRVLSEPDPYWRGMIDAKAFRSQMQVVRRYFNPVSLPKALDDLKNNSLPSRAVAITFDDGYADNATNALPILKDLGLTATFFIATDFINGGAMWLDKTVEAIREYPDSEINLEKIGLGCSKTQTIEQKKQLLINILFAFRHMEIDERNEKAAYIIKKSKPADLKNIMLTSGQLLAMKSAGMTIGAHTKGHPNLCNLSPEKAFDQIAGSKEVLEKILHQPVDLFAYPFGKENLDFSKQHANIVRELGFKAAVTTDRGVTDKKSDLYRLPRFTPWDKTQVRFALRLAANHSISAAHQEID